LEVDYAEGSLMSNINVPNDIAGGQTMDPRPIQANFEEIEAFINDDVFTVDAQKALEGKLTLFAAGTEPDHAVNKAQLDEVAKAGVDERKKYLPLTGGTLTGPLYVSKDGLAVTIGNDVALHDINVANTLGVYGVQNSTVGNVKLGSGGPLLSGAAGKLTVSGDITAASATVNGNLTVSGTITGNGLIESKFVQDVVSSNNIDTTPNYQKILETSVTNKQAGHYIVTVSLDVLVQQAASERATPAFVAVLKAGGTNETAQIVWKAKSLTSNEVAKFNPMGTRNTVNRVWIIPAEANNTVAFEVHVRHSPAADDYTTYGYYRVNNGSDDHTSLQVLFVAGS
jgi:hypothetical protein